jgi:acyl carrier protein
MDRKVIQDIKKVIINSVGFGVPIDSLTEDFPLVGNILDSMAITNLILALEEHFDFFFDDDELSAEVFETVGSLTDFINQKVAS